MSLLIKESEKIFADINQYCKTGINQKTTVVPLVFQWQEKT